MEIKRKIILNMENMESNLNEQKQLISSKNILFIQDIDGVCIPLVKDPMTRELESKYIYAVKKFAEEFFVLTCGEHEGPRAVSYTHLTLPTTCSV